MSDRSQAHTPIDRSSIGGEESCLRIRFDRIRSTLVQSVLAQVDPMDNEWVRLTLAAEIPWPFPLAI